MTTNGFSPDDCDLDWALEATERYLGRGRGGYQSALWGPYVSAMLARQEGERSYATEERVYWLILQHLSAERSLPAMRAEAAE